MNGTIIDIPGINVNVNPVSMEHSPDCAHVIEIKDQHGKVITICTAFGKITKVETNHTKA